MINVYYFMIVNKDYTMEKFPFSRKHLLTYLLSGCFITLPSKQLKQLQVMNDDVKTVSSPKSRLCNQFVKMFLLTLTIFTTHEIVCDSEKNSRNP